MQRSIMRLSEAERRVVVSLQLRADASVHELAEEVGIREHSARRIISKLQQSGLLRPYPLIDIFAIGNIDLTVFCSLAISSSKTRERFLGALGARPEVSWVIEVGGEYQYGFGVCASSLQSARSVIEEVARPFGQVFGVKSSIQCLGWSIFHRKYLTEFLPKVRKQSVGSLAARPNTTIDGTDRRILALLAVRPRASASEIGRSLLIPVSTVAYRIHALLESGVLTGIVYGVECYLLGMYVFRISLCLKGMGAEVRVALYSYCEKHPNVVAFVDCFGVWDVSLRVEVFQAEDAFVLVQELQERFSDHISTINLLPVFREKKLSPVIE